MATVHLARQRDLDRLVALKELGAFHAADPAFAQRFVRESRVAGSLSHANIVTVHDYFEHDGTPYIAMEYVEGGSLRAPRPQARERHGELARADQDRRLRDCEGDDEPPDRRVPDRYRGHRRDAELHGPGAGDGAAGRALDRPLLGRLHGL